MKPTLPFRHENDKNFFNSIHPLIRFIIPFILVIPFLIFNDLFLTITIILIVLIINLIFQLQITEIISRLKVLIPFILLITIFLPLYIGNTIAFQIHIGIPINFYVEGLNLALLLFFRILGAAFIFLTFFSSLTYSEFIEALTKIRVIPSFFVGSIVIMLHYIPILASSNKKVLEAQELRGKNITTYWHKLKAHGFIMGKNIVNNLERSEKLYESLKMRGFTGKISFVSRKLKIIDIITLVFFLFIVIIFVYFINLEQIYMEVFKLFFP